jgi:hypothetical protein
MADKRISQLIERTDIANNDVLPIVASGATTTNKVTISTIQDWMQDNLDVGVTSVGITLGTSGTDVNVSGSPITTSGNITINIPDASASARGVVTTGSQTFAGVKTFANGLSLPAVGGSNQITRIVNIGTLHEGTASLNQIGFNSGNNIYFGKGLSNGGVISWNNSTVRYYTLPDADGTLALASQLDGYVTLGTAQTITGSKTFNSRIIGQYASLTGSGSADTLEVTHTSGSGIAVDISKAGNGEGLRVAKTSGSGNAVTISGGALVGETGLFSGDLQSATRVIAAASSQSIILTPNSGGTTNRVESVGTLPLALVSAAAITLAAGGTTPQITLATTGAVTLTGALNGTSASFSGTLTLNGADNRINSGNELRFYRTDNAIYSRIFDAGSSFIFDNRNGNGFSFQSAGTNQFSIASTGAATFSSSVGVGAAPTGTYGTLSVSGGVSIKNDNNAKLEIGRYSAGVPNSYIKLGPNSNSLRFTNNTDIADLFVIENGGNVGIGTTSPSVKLQAESTINTTYSPSDTLNGGVIAYIKNASTTNSTDATIRLEATGSSSVAAVSISAVHTGAGSSDLTFGTRLSASNVTERMRITSSGNVGIGTASPTDRGHINTAGSGASDRALRLSNPNQNFADCTAELVFQGGYNSTYEGASTIRGGRATAGNDSYLSFFTNPGGTSVIERMRITAGGDLLVGITSTYTNARYQSENITGTKAPMALRAQATSGSTLVEFWNPNGQIGSIQTSGSSTSFVTSSDYRLKENVKPFENAFSILSKLKPCTFNFIADQEEEVIGFLAHEVQEVIPQAVTGEKDGFRIEEVEVSPAELDEEGNVITEAVVEEKEIPIYQGIDHSKLVPLLVAAIQELKAEIDSLKTK